MVESFDRGVQSNVLFGFGVDGTAKKDRIHVLHKSISNEVIGDIRLETNGVLLDDKQQPTKAAFAVQATFHAYGEFFEDDPGPDVNQNLLRWLANKLGGDHFNWYQVIVEDEGSVTPFGERVTVPYIDPPRGGLGAKGSPDTQLADNIPWYYEEIFPAGLDPSSERFQLTIGPNIRGDRLHFDDDPHFDENGTGTLMRFRTWLVVVKGEAERFRPVIFLGGFEWTAEKQLPKPTTNERLTNGRIVGVAPTSAPNLAEYEDLLNKPHSPNVPAWFDLAPLA